MTDVAQPENVETSRRNCIGETGENAAAVHLDTTVMLEQFKAEPRPTKVQTGLSGFRFKSTSTYARHELNRTWLRDLAYLYTAAMQVKSIADLYARIGSSFSGGQQNRLTRCLEIVQKHLGQVPTNVSLDEALLRLREHLSHATLNAQKYWDSLVHHHFDETRCVRAWVRPQRGDDDRIDYRLTQCRRDKIRCNIHKLFNAEYPKFAALVAQTTQRGNGASQQSQQAAEEIQQATTDPERLCDDRVCARIGDALIAVDSGNVGTLAANNDADWEPIASSLKRKLLNPCK